MLKKVLTRLTDYRHQTEEQAFLALINDPNAYSVALKSHLILWISFVFIIVAIVWARFATIDEITRGKGRIIPSSHIQVIQNLEGGILSEILVKEGDRVEQGQTLLKLDAVRFASSFNETKLKQYELQATVARLNAEVNNQDIDLPVNLVDQYPEIARQATKLLASRRNELSANKKILNEQIRQKQQTLVELKSKQNQLAQSYHYLKKELSMSEPLVAEGAMSPVELLRLKRSANDLYGELNAARLSIPRLQSSLDEAKNKLSELEIRFHTEALEELSKAKAELDRLDESITAIQDRVTRTQIISPVSGTVKQIKVTTLGGVIQPGMDLIEIVPLDDLLLIEAEIRPADIAFLSPGQKAMVKLTAYDFSIYGGLAATLDHISADTITNEQDNSDYYLIRLVSNKNYIDRNGEKLKIISGMTVDVDILTGRKSVLDYLLKPILKAKDIALTER
jgi:membrane fusion protein, adhesin transport system